MAWHKHLRTNTMAHGGRPAASISQHRTHIHVCTTHTPNIHTHTVPISISRPLKIGRWKFEFSMAVATPCGRTISKICGRRNAIGTQFDFPRVPQNSQLTHTIECPQFYRRLKSQQPFWNTMGSVPRDGETSKFIWNRLFLLFFGRDAIFICIQIMQYRTCWMMFTVRKAFRHTSVKSPFAITHFSFITAIKEIRQKKKKITIRTITLLLGLLMVSRSRQM